MKQLLLALAVTVLLSVVAACATRAEPMVVAESASP